MLSVLLSYLIDKVRRYRHQLYTGRYHFCMYFPATRKRSFFSILVSQLPQGYKVKYISSSDYDSHDCTNLDEAKKIINTYLVNSGLCV